MTCRRPDRGAGRRPGHGSAEPPLHPTAAAQADWDFVAHRAAAAGELVVRPLEAQRWGGREWVLIAVAGLLLFGPLVRRWVVGYRCPSCRRARLRYLWPLNDTFAGFPDYRAWRCPACGGRFRERPGEPLEWYTAELAAAPDRAGGGAGC